MSEEKPDLVLSFKSLEVEHLLNKGVHVGYWARAVLEGPLSTKGFKDFTVLEEKLSTLTFSVTDTLTEEVTAMLKMQRDAALKEVERLKERVAELEQKTMTTTWPSGR